MTQDKIRAKMQQVLYANLDFLFEKIEKLNQELNGGQNQKERKEEIKINPSQG